MDLYQLGKDVQAIHEKLDKLVGKKCGCSKGAQGGSSSDEILISKAVLTKLREQLHYLANAAAGSDFVTGERSTNTWEGFLEKYNPGRGFDWCCRCDGSFGERHCHNITAATEADALAGCMLVYCNSGASVTYKKCGPSDACQFGP